MIWTGEKSIELGLVDALGSPGYVAREVIGAEDIVDFTKRKTFMDQFASKIGAVFARTMRSILAGFEFR